MNKRGFTLIEVLSAIVIIAIIAGIGTVAYTMIIKTVGDRVFERYRDTMHAEAIYLLTNHPEKVTWSGNTARITLSQLEIEPIKNPNNKDDLCTGSYVNAIRSHNSTSGVLSITYTVCLECPNSNLAASFTKCKTYEN